MVRDAMDANLMCVFFNTTQRLITLNGMKASEEITEEQSRQVVLASQVQELR